MPDLTTEYAWACETRLLWQTQVDSSSGGTQYTVRFGMLLPRDADIQGAQYGWTCTCKGFDIRRTCSHVTRVAANDGRDTGRCNWDARWEDGMVHAEKDGDPPRCPRCSGPVFSYSYGA